MRIGTLNCLNKQWFVQLYFREIGRPFPVAVGGNWIEVGRGREFFDRVTMVQIDVEKNVDDIRLLPGMRPLAICTTPHRVSDEEARSYMKRLRPEWDEVELVNPHQVAIMEDMGLAREVVQGNDQLLQQLQVLEGKRNRFLGGPS